MDLYRLLGRRLKIDEVRSSNAQAITVSQFDGWVQFDADGSFVINDSVNVHSGSFELVPRGMRLMDVGSTLVGYGGRDPARAALGNAVTGFAQDGAVVLATCAGEKVVFETMDQSLVCLS